jgi:hypothetical protein
MKKCMWAFFVMFSSVLFSQSFHAPIDLGITIPPLLSDKRVFVNKNGMHLVTANYQNSSTNGSINYYRINTLGAHGSQDVLLLGTGEYPRIVGNEDTIYIVFKSQSQIKTFCSIDGGMNWNGNIVQPFTPNNNNDFVSNGLEIVKDNLGLHVVWSQHVSESGQEHYRTYYRRFIKNVGWGTIMEVSNTNNYTNTYYGGFPSITFSGDKIHVACTDVNLTSPGYIRGTSWERVFHLGSSPFWDEPVILGADALHPDFCCDSKIIYAGNYIHIFYTQYITGSGFTYSNIMYRQRLIDDEHGWSNPIIIDNLSDATWSFDIKTCDSPTMDNGQIGISYIIVDNNYVAHVGYRTYNVPDNIWDDGIFVNASDLATVAPYNSYLGINSLIDASVCFSSSSYDRFFIYNPSNLTSQPLLYRQFDSYPKAPQNFTLTSSINSHPLLSWTLSNEPDVRLNGYYILERRLRNNTNPITWGAWSVFPNIANGTNQYEDMSINNATGAGPGHAEYRLKAIDYYNYSSYTNSLGITYGTSSQKIIGKGEMVNCFALQQNYPNPFNPSTNISYQLPKAGFVQLNVYNLLGKEVAVLVNEFKSEGKYSINFDATGLSSGVYIYTLKVNDFIQNQKMTIMK